jgi:hypothetical protein
MELPETLAAWGHPEFAATFKRELAACKDAAHQDAAPLQATLQAALRQGSYVDASPLEVMLLHTEADADTLQIKAVLFFASVIAGCSCADDPSPVDVLIEHAEVQVRINRHTGQADVTLLSD